MNRQQRRAAARAVAKAIDERCLAGDHDFAGAWVMRPAWVGAGITIPKVHFDRPCRRCKRLEIRWVDIEGDRTPLERAMSLSDWLTVHGATVKAPPGEIRVPNVGELAELARKAGLSG